MNYLVDTCVIAEWKKKKPNQKVLNWLGRLNFIDIFISILTIGEIEKGILALPEGRRREDLKSWLEDLVEMFAGRIIDLGRDEIATWARIVNEAEKQGTPSPAIDSLFAATAITHNLTVATRNTKDIAKSGVEVFNPWTD